MFRALKPSCSLAVRRVRPCARIQGSLADLERGVWSAFGPRGRRWLWEDAKPFDSETKNESPLLSFFGLNCRSLKNVVALGDTLYNLLHNSAFAN